MRLGLVSEVARRTRWTTTWTALVDALLQNGPQAVRAAKKLVVDVAGRDITAELIEDTCGVSRRSGFRMKDRRAWAPF